MWEDMGLEGGEGETRDAQIACMCAFDDGAVWEGDVDAVVGCCGSDIFKVIGYFKEMAGGAGVHYDWRGGDRFCGVNLFAIKV
jgi:hypothetical protein